MLTTRLITLLLRLKVCKGKHPSTEKAVFFLTEGGKGADSASAAGVKQPQWNDCRNLLLLSKRKVLKGQRSLPLVVIRANS